MRRWGVERTLGSLMGGTGLSAALLLIERVREGVAPHRRDAKLRSCKVMSCNKLA
jgi:hypothetical protein